MFDGLAYAAAVVLAAVFAVAGTAKLRDPAGTSRSFRALGLPPVLGRVVPVLELGVATGLLLLPGVTAIAALALLAAFTTFLVLGIKRGVTVPCNCFGSSSRAPLSGRDLARNAALEGAAVVSLFAGGPTLPGPGAVLVVAAATVAVVVALRASDREGPRVGRPAPPVDGLRPPALLAFVSPGCPRCELDRPAFEARGAHVLELSPTTAVTFTAYGVRATPFYVEVDADGVVRGAGPELSDLQSAT